MQFTVFHNANPHTRAAVPFLLNVQSDLIEKAATCVVVPLIPIARAAMPASRLMPVFELDGGRVVMDTLQLAGISRKALGAPVADLSPERATILGALDLLISGI